ncbi:MAG: hypothetical protein NC320_01865 [Clostridium sp.]|nr:hypothetical protein [Clostridium sp.]
MKFTVSTKPLKNGVNLCIIDANVMEHYTKSKLVQITADTETLRINHAANLILSEVTFKGIGEGESASIMVDPLMFRKLISTFTAPQVEFEFTGNALILHDGKSSFSLPMRADTSEAQLPMPNVVTEDDVLSGSDILISEWKFIKDYQMYAKGNSDKNVIYNYVWVSENGDVLVGNFAESLFTHSTVSKLGKTCLLTDTIINLFNSLPEGAKIINKGSAYSIAVSTDGYKYISEFTPLYESEENGDYNSEIIIGMMNADEANISKVNTADFIKILNQAVLLTTEKIPIIKYTFEKNQITFKDSKVNAAISVEGGPETPYTLDFSAKTLKSVISNCPDSTISISPTFNDGEVVGINISSGNLTLVLAGME